MIGETLDDLERVLLEIANAPEDVTAEDWRRCATRSARAACCSECASCNRRCASASASISRTRVVG